MRSSGSARREREIKRLAFEVDSPRNPGGRNFPPLWEVTVDNGDGTYDLEAADGQTTTNANVVRSSILPWEDGQSLTVGDRGVLVERGDGTVVLFVGGASSIPEDPVTADVTVGTVAETEAAQTDTWTVGDGTLEKIVLYRMAYDHLGDEKLYAYYRTEKYDAQGRLVSISAETRVTIDTAEDCT